ncbi:hypothetical protein DFP72DRAFT_751184, partial [Ephemerocybe angulata]
IQLIFNAQHGCGACGCRATGTRPRRVERELSDLVEAVIDHTDDLEFVVNTHALHNAAKIRSYLPRSLTEPLPLISPDSRVQHCWDIASVVREKQPDKRGK